MQSINLTIAPDSRIRLAGYTAAAAKGLCEAELVQSWYAVAAQQPPGFIYRELCAAMPDWNRQIEGEIQVPNPYVYLDYAVLRTTEAAAALSDPAVPDLVEQYGVFLNLVNGPAAAQAQMLLFNLFSVSGPPELVDSFAAAWQPRGQFQAQQPGFGSALLHRSIDPAAPFAAFNRAEWRDVAHYAATLPAFERTFPRAQRMRSESAGPPPIRSHLGLFRRLAAVPLR